MSKTTEKSKSMKELAEKIGSGLVPLKKGSTIEVEVLKVTRNRIVVNVNGLGFGIIPEKEFSQEFLNLKPKDKVLAYLIDLENDDGYAVFSLKRADRERVWQNLKEKMDTSETIKVKVVDANRGGLIVQFGSMEGFLPLSQLSQRYHINFSELGSQDSVGVLKGLVDKIMDVKIISLEKSSNKLIFSEKIVSQENKKDKIKEIYTLGQKVKGKITGIVPFGLFINLGESEGLIHISEVSWERVNDLNKLYKTGEEIEAEIIDLENGKVSLSVKRLLPDPWVKKVENFQKDKLVNGKVIRITPFGVFVELDNKVNGLVHISEFNDGKEDNKTTKPEEVLEVGKDYEFKILSIEPETHKINLSIVKDEEEKKSKKK